MSHATWPRTNGSSLSTMSLFPEQLSNLKFLVLLLPRYAPLRSPASSGGRHRDVVSFSRTVVTVLLSLSLVRGKEMREPRSVGLQQYKRSSSRHRRQHSCRRCLRRQQHVMILLLSVSLVITDRKRNERTECQLTITLSVAHLNIAVGLIASNLCGLHGLGRASRSDTNIVVTH